MERRTGRRTAIMIFKTRNGVEKMSRKDYLVFLLPAQPAGTG